VIDDFQDLPTRKDCNNSGISMLSFNVRSLKDPKQKHLFISWLQTMDPSIVTVNETWFNDQIKSSELFPEDYIVFRKDRANGKGGVVLLAIKSHLAPNRLLNIENNSELLWIEITNKHKKVLIFSAYRSPSYKDIFIFELIDSFIMASDISDKYHACLVTGDFNLQIDWLGVAHRPLNTMSELFIMFL
jgi:exonuclease III